MKRRPYRVVARSVAPLAVAAMLHPGAASADERAAPTAGRESVTLTTSLVTPFFSAYEVEAALRASHALGVVVNASYVSLASNDSWKAKIGTVGAGVNYYFLGTALRRWYVQGITELMFASWRHEPSGEVAPLVLGCTGVFVAGYQFVWDAGPVLDVGAGLVVFHSPSAHVDFSGGSASSGAFDRLYPAVKVNVGWAF